MEPELPLSHAPQLPPIHYISLEQITDKTAIPFSDLEKSEKYAQEIIDIFNGKLKKSSDAVINYAIGSYYFTKKEYFEMKKHYLLAIKQGHTNAMYCLALYYIKETGHVELMIKYMKMAIEKNNTLAMIWFGDYCRYVAENYDDMMKYYLLAIKYGNTDGIINIANYYKDIKNDNVATKRYYTNAAEKGNHKGMFLLAEYYYVIEDDMKKAKKYYLMAAEQGNFLAMYLTGVFYFKVEKDIPNALKFFKMAADNGNSHAMNGLANYYYDIDNNIELGIKYYIMAADHGSVEAMASLSNHYYRQKDFKSMIKYSELAVAYGHKDLFNHLGIYYSSYEKNSKKALEWFHYGIKKDNSESMLCAAIEYYNIGQYEKTEKYYKEAIEKGNDKVHNYLGFYYLTFKNDYQKAIQCFMDGILKGEIDCLFNIATVYYRFEKYDLAEKYFLLSIEKGNNTAINCLGFYYQNIKQDYQKALELFESGIQKGDNDSLLNIASLYYLLGKYDLAEKYFLMSVEKNDCVAANNLGFYYQHVKKDFQNAEKYYMIAHETGDQYSIYNLYTLYKMLEGKQEEMEKYYQTVLQINAQTGIFTNLLK